MIRNCFVQQEATLEIISNETIFYDMKSCCYLCIGCQEALAENLDINCEAISTESNKLF